MEQSNLVQVQFQSKYDNDFSGKHYTYITDHALRVGDIVTVPTQYGDSKARVCRVDVPEQEVAAFRDRLRHITSPPDDILDPFAAFFDPETE